jgi:hypothetical protein
VIYLTLWLAACSLAFAAITAASFTPGGKQWSLTRLARQAELGVPIELEAALGRRAAARSRWPSLAALAILIILYAVFRSPIGALTPQLFGVCAVAGIAGLGIGTAIVSLRFEARLSESPVSVARIRTVSVGDYVGYQARVVAYALVIVFVAAVVTGLALENRSPLRPGAFLPSEVAALLAVGGLILFEVGSRAILRRGQPAASTDELVWDDALRSSAINDLLRTPVLSSYLGVLSLVLLGPALPGHDTWIAVLGYVVVVGFYLLFSLAQTGLRGYYLAKLWPNARRRTEAEESARVAALPAGGVSAAGVARADRERSAR